MFPPQPPSDTQLIFFYFTYFFFQLTTVALLMCTVVSVVIDSTRFCHGFANNLSCNMEAMNFSQPTQRHNGKAGGVGRGRCCDAGIITCARSQSGNMVALIHLKLEGGEGMRVSSRQFGSVSHQVSDGKCNYFYQLEFIWVARQRQWCFESSESWSQSARVSGNSRVPTSQSVPTDSDHWNCWSETDKWSKSSWKCHWGNISSTLSLYRSDALFPIS